MNLLGVAEEIQHRIIHIFARDSENRRATNGCDDRLDFDPNFRDYVWFYEVVCRLDGTLICADIMFTVLPWRQRSRSRCVAPDRLVWPCRVSYSSERCHLPSAQDAQE